MKKYIITLKSLKGEDYITSLSERKDSFEAVTNAEKANPGYSFYFIKEYVE